MKFNSVGFKRMGQFGAVIFICLAVIGCRQWIEMLTNSRNANPTTATSLVSQPDTGASANLLSGDKLSSEFPEVSAEERDYLLSVYRDTWNYLADFVEPSTGLPYDSNKKQPATSVSNIGLYLGSTAVAYRTGLITKEEALSRISAAFTSLKKLETWRGFPRVWAAVRSLQPIHGSDTFSYSKHIANLIGGLTLVQTIFPEEYNQAVGSYIRELDFKGMYDAGTGWIKGGYDLKLQDFAVNQPFGPWHYKFLASESRLISYYLIARGFAPSSHWNSLIRTIQNGDGDWFMVPGLEDGGAYMPYMAGLYVDERDMLIGTSQKNYSHSSMTHAANIGASVWGWSASLDTRGEYVPYGQLRDEIVAPYASMLAVHYFPKEVVSNLQALEKIGARPETEAKLTTEVWSAFADKRSVFAAPYAFIHNGAVFLIAQDGAVLPLKDYLIPDTAGRPLDLKSDRELNLFFKALNIPDYLGQFASALVQSVSAGTGVSKELEKIMGGSEQLQGVLALAAHTGEFQLGEIRLKDGTVFKTLWLDQKGVWIPKAIATKTELYFLNAEGTYEKLNMLLDNTESDQSVTGYDRDRAAFVAAITGHAGSLKDGAVLLKQGTRFSEALRNQAKWTPLDAAEIAALATHVQDFKPAKLFFADGTELELAVDRPGIRWVPWAAAQKGEVYFLNSEGVIENLSRYVKKTSAGKKVFPYDSVVLNKLLTAAKISAVAGPLPQGVPQKEQAFPADTFSPDLASRLRSPEARLGLQALAVSAGLYQPGKIQLPDGMEYSVLWTLSEGIHVPWAVATESDILFISDHKKLVSLKGYLSQNQLTLEAVDSASALKFFAAGGLLTGSASKGAVTLDEISFGTAMRSTLADEIQEESMRADLLGLAVKAGLADVPLAKLSQGAQISALWTDQPASPTPWALANTKEVVFISPARGTLETVSSYLDQNQINQPISNLDRRTLVVFAEDLGFKPEPGQSAQDYFKQAVFGTFLKPSLRQDVADSALRQALLGLTATAGLYTPAKIELADGSSASLLLVERGDQWLAVATATDGKVFYLGRDHQSHRLNDFENNRAGLAQVSSYQRFPLDILAAGLGYSLRQGESLADRVQSVTLGTSRSESLAQSLDDAEILPELEALARHAHVTQPGQVQLVDNTAFGVAFSDFRNRQVPYAAVTGGGTTDVTFLNREGLQRNLSQYFDNTLLGQKTQAYDRLSLKDLLVKAGVPIKGPAPEVILGTVVKSELLSQVSSPEQMSELLALAGKTGLYQPGRIEMKDVGTFSVLLIKQGELYQPWAVASGKNLYFKNKKNGVESLDRFIAKGTPQVFASGADLQSTLFLSGKDFTGAPASIDYRAMQQTRFNPGAADLAISADQAAELVGLASAAGAYDPVHVKLTETKIAHYGFRDSVDWKSGKVTPYYLTPSQGMAFLSLANFLYDGVVWKAFSENAKMKTTLEKLREIDRTQNLLGDQAQRGCMLLPKNQTRAA